VASAFGRKLQVVIDKMRGKPRRSDPIGVFSVSPREALKRVRPSGGLEKLFYAHDGRTAIKWHHYLAIYDQHFQSLRDRLGRGPRILELGVSHGGSLQLWRKYFGPEARIVGVDIDPACIDRVDPGSFVVIGDQTDPTVLAAAIEQLGGGVDLIIDDGSHLGRHQIASFEYLYPRLSVHGLYACEDIQYCYSSEFEGGYRRDGTFVEYAKGLIDRLHAWHLDGELKKNFMDFARTTYGIFFYVDLIVIEKRPIEMPFHVQMGKG
jgi:FtsJ-like methyltransferase